MEEKTISVNKLQEKLNNDERVFVLDVRPSEQRNEWMIAGSAHVDAYKPLNAGDETALDMVDIPQEATVVTVCAAGRTSLLASALLDRKGIKAYSLEGGMKAWNFAWNTAELTSQNGVQVIQVRRAAKGILSYVVASANEAVVIDAALDPDVYTKIAHDNNWTIKYAMDTHIHADYVSRTRELAEVTQAGHLLIDQAEIEFPVKGIPNGAKVEFGNTEIQFIHTPGHTWESTTFRVDNLLFTGDTLFIDGIGRPDLKAEKEEAAKRAKALFKSLNLLLSYDAQMIVLPAHTATAVAFDKKIIADTVQHIRERIGMSRWNESSFTAYTLSKIPPTPPNYLTIAGLNKKGSHEGHTLADLEAGGNHCAIA
jgi:glyoxylase-like metal-dependent hydrolase (beta-lactamase superfamily II)/rhodanese-related sulfurtransferase